MRILSLIAALLVVGNTEVTAWGADLTKIDRTIAKEAAYESKPAYCLLVFGLEAKTRVWLVLDGDTLYADRNGNGDLTEKGERFVPAQGDKWLDWEVGDVAGPNGKDTYTGLSVRQYSEARPSWDVWSPGLGISVKVPLGTTRVVQSAGTLVYYHKYRLHFAARPEDAPVIHFGGPLRMILLHPERLAAGVRAGVRYEVEARVGTPGLGKDTTAIMDDGVLMGHTDPSGTVLEYTDQQGLHQRLGKTLVYD